MTEIDDSEREDLIVEIMQRLERRGVIAGGAGLLTGAGLVAGASGDASAGTDQVGSLGTDNNRLDAEIEDLDLTDQSSTPSGPGSGQVRMYFKNGTPYYLPEGGSETELGGGGSSGYKAPVAARVYKDGSTVIAEQRDGTTIDSGGSAATVWQSAIDFVHNNATINDSYQDYTPEGFIDGGMENYTLTASIQHKDRVGIRNAIFDANGNTGFSPYTASPTDSRTYVRGLVLENIAVLNSGDSVGMDITQGGWAPIGHNVVCSDHGSDGVRLQGCVGALFYNLSAAENSGRQVYITDTGSVDGNYNRIIGGNLRGTGSTSSSKCLLIKKTDTDAKTRANVIRNVNFERASVGVHVDDRGVDTIVENCWFESPTFGDQDILINGTGSFNDPTRNQIRQNTTSGTIKVDNASDTVLELNTGGNVTIDITSAASGTRLKDNDLFDATINDNGSGTRWVVDAGEPYRIEAGSVDFGDPGTPSDGTWDTLTESSTTTVTYDTPYNSSPKLFTQAEIGAGTGKELIRNADASGFDLSWAVFRSNASSSTTINWLAVGQ